MAMWHVTVNGDTFDGTCYLVLCILLDEISQVKVDHQCQVVPRDHSNNHKI